MSMYVYVLLYVYVLKKNNNIAQFMQLTNNIYEMFMFQI